MLCDMNSAPGKSPSVWRVVAIAGAGVLFASAMAPARAAAMPAKPVLAKKKLPDLVRPQQPAGRGGGSASPLSLQWMMGSGLRP
jgi:hypothetical protein